MKKSKVILVLVIIGISLAFVFLYPKISKRYEDKVTHTSYYFPEGWEATHITWDQIYTEPVTILKKGLDEIWINRTTKDPKQSYDELVDMLTKEGARFADHLVPIGKLTYYQLAYSYEDILSERKQTYYEGYFLSRPGEGRLKGYVIALFSQPETYAQNKEILRKLVESIRYK